MLQRHGYCLKSPNKVTYQRILSPNLMGRLAMKHLDRITINPEQCGGRPCIRGLRVRVKDILDLLAEQVPPETILKDYPYLEREDIQAALEYAATQVDHPVLQSS